MTPELTSIIAAFVILCLTVITIIHMILIDMQHHRSGKAKRANRIVWMIVVGVIFNIPFMYKALSGLN